MEIEKNIEIVDLALYLKKHKALIISDLHIGYEEELQKKGVLVPMFQFKDIVKRLTKILRKTKPKLIIVNGDLKHEFGTISDQEWRETLKILDLLTKYGKVILIKGNHDNILGPIARKRDVEIKDYFYIDNIYITHGNIIPKNKDFQKSKVIIIGHEHPAINLKEDMRIEKFKCFLKGKYTAKAKLQPGLIPKKLTKRKILIVQPSFLQVIEGTDILNEGLLSPFLDNIKNFEIFVVEDKVYRFGKVKDHL